MLKVINDLILDFLHNLEFYDYVHIFLVILFLLFLHGFYKRLVLLRMFYGSFINIHRFGHVVAVSGAIRSGKTTLVGGLSHLYTFKIINSLQKRIEEIELILKEINFVKIRDKVESFDIDLDNFENKIDFIFRDFLMSDDFGQCLFSHDLNIPYFDFLKYQDKVDLLKEYIYLYLHLKRSNYIYSNVLVYNHIMKFPSFAFKNEWIKLKENQDFPLLEYSVFIEDDKLIFDSNIGSMKKLYIDSGSDLFFRLFGHLFRETSYYICTVQDINRWIKLEREIAQTFIHVFSSNVVGNYPKINWVLQACESVLKFIYNRLHWVVKREEYFEEENFFKKIFFKIHQLRKKLFSKAFVRFDVGIYNDIDKVGKEIKEEDQFSYYYSFVIPIPYVYGSLNTHEFHFLYNYLYNRSKLKYRDLKETEIKGDEIDYILKKYDEKNSTGFVVKNDDLKDVF